MHSSTLLLALVAALFPLVEAHGKVTVAAGDVGGNTTALGILGGIVPGTGSTSKTEVDTTVFSSRKIATDGLGKTPGNGQNTLDDLSRAIALSGSTLPQVSLNGGFISGTYHIVTADGAGPIQAIIDPSGTGQFSKGTQAKVETQVPGNNGNIARHVAFRGLTRKALKVNTDHPFKIAVPAGTACTGTIAGRSKVCLMKIANTPGGPFGGVIAFQIAQGSSKASGQKNAGKN